MRRLLRDGGAPCRRLFLAGLVSLLLVTSACGGEGLGQAGRSSSNSGSGGLSFAEVSEDLAHGTRPIAAYPAVPRLAGGAKPLKGKSVWYIPIASSIPIASAVGSAMKEALAAAGVQMHVCDGRLLPTTISSCMSQAVTQHADAVVTGFIDYSLVPTAFDRLISHDIKVLVAGEAPSGGRASSQQLAFYDATPSFQRAEHLALKSVMADSNGRAKILFVAITNSSLTRNVAKNARAFIARECPGCSYDEVAYATAEIAKLPSRVSAALLQKPDTTHVVVSFDSGVNATLQGVRAAGFEDKVALASVSGNLDALKRVRAGNQLTVVGLSPVYFGWSYADGALRLLAGQPVFQVHNPARVFARQNVGNLKLTHQAYATNVWYGTEAYRNSFLHAWGVS
ncbi:substrate-binding domain-containing protein [Streptomyces sp. NPDC126514]|uniref:sugar ABC transporter substrate-binding protein n=1 Tax=Streptomyces sp. NPDC126514 TaxID=3155210 RepID=UPI0033253883